MRRLLALIWLLVLASPALAVTCDDGVTLKANADDCPTRLFNASVSNVTTTSASIDGVNDAAGIGATRKMFASASTHPPGCTSAHYAHADLSSADPAVVLAAKKAKAQCVDHILLRNGTGAISTASETLVYAGSFAKVITGLPTGTTSYVHFAAYGGKCDAYPNHTSNCQNPSAMSLVETVQVQTPASSTDENIATGGEERYLSSTSCNDLNTGLSDAQAWCSLSKITGALPAGTDINLEVGSTFTSKLSLSHAGTALDRVDVTGYKMVSGTAKVAVSGDTLPKIVGGLDSSCLTAGTCLYTPAAFAGDVTGSEYGAMIEGAATADYVTLRWLAIEKSRGRCISFAGTGSAGSLTNLRLEHLTITDCGFEGLVFESGIRHLVVKDVDLLRINTCETQRYQTGTSNTTQCNSAGWAADIQNTRNPAQYALYYNVSCVAGFGECFNFWNNDASYSILSNVRASNGLSRGVTADTTSDIVVEASILMGQPDSPSIGWYAGSAGRWGNNLIASYEAFMLPDSTEPGLLVRNSMMIRTGKGIECYIEFDAITAGRRCTIRAYGNLIIGSEDYGIYTESGSDLLDVQNNVFWEEGLTATTICSLTGTLTGKTFAEQHWYTNPSDSDCDGTGDTYGAPGLAATKSYAGWRTWTAGTFPGFVADATPQAGSPLLDSGADLSVGTDVLNATSYNSAFNELATLTGVTAALWQRPNAYNAIYGTRDSSPNKGPL